MLNIEETAQTQMHLLYKMGALLEWEETWWEDKKKQKTKREQKQPLHYSNVSNYVVQPLLIFIFSFLSYSPNCTQRSFREDVVRSTC